MTISNKFGWMVLTTRQQERDGDRLRHALRRHGRRLRGHQGRAEDARVRAVPRPQRRAPAARSSRSRSSTSRRRPSCARIRRTPTRCPPYDVLDPIIEGYVEGDESVAELDRARSRRRARAARRAHGRPQRVQAPAGAARCARVAEGVRQGPPAADHQPLARLTQLVSRRRLADAAAVPARARADRGDDRVRRDVQDRPGRARRRHAGRLHPVAVHRRRRSCSLPFAFAARLAARRRARRDAPRLRRSRRVAFGVVGFARLLVPERRPRTHDDVELGVHHRPVRRVHAADRDRGDAAARRPRNVLVAVGVSAVGLVPARPARTFSLGAGDALDARRARSCSAIWIFLGGTLSQRFDPIALTAAQMSRARRCSRSRSSSSAGIGDDHRAGRRSRWSFTGVVCSAVAFTLQLWGQRYVEPSRAAVILLFEPVVAGFVGYLGRRAARRRAATSARS